MHYLATHQAERSYKDWQTKPFAKRMRACSGGDVRMCKTDTITAQDRSNGVLRLKS